MKRILALLAAAVLVVGAIVLRRVIDDDVSDDADALTLVCGTELEAACTRLGDRHDGIELVVEDEEATARRIASGELELDDSTAWLAAAPWPAIAAAGVPAGGEAFPDLAGSAVLAESPAVIVAREDRMEAISRACGTPSWACIGDHAGGSWTDLGGETTWGRVEVGLPPAGTGAGAVAVNQAVASRVGTTDFAINDLDDEPATGAWFDRLASQSTANGRDDLSAIEQFLRVPGSLGVVGALGAEATRALDRASAGSDISTVIPEPRSLAQVRLWSGDRDTLDTAVQRLDLKDLRTSLTDSGWDAPGTGSDATAGTMVSDDQGPNPDAGLPGAGVMSAVITRWEDVR